MLDRGDAFSQRLALYAATGTQDPTVKQALHKYLRGERGTDTFRLALLTRFQWLGEPLESPLMMYIKGKQESLDIIPLEVTDEPIHKALPDNDIHQLYAQGFEALYRRDGVAAEKALRQVREAYPDRPDVLNNFVIALHLQGRYEEAQPILDDIQSRFPEYFFGTIRVAMGNVNEGAYPAALTILRPLLSKGKYHTTEFTALARAMGITTARSGQLAQAKYWLALLKNFTPGVPEIQQVETALERQTAIV